MAFAVADRVRETTTTTGTGTLNLGGAVSGFRTFVSGIGDGNVTYYAIVHRTAAEFEIGIGTVTDASTDTLSRTTILSSSNSNSAVSFSAGTKDVFCTLPASKLIFEDGSDNLNVASLKNTSLVVGRDADNDIDFATDNNIIFRAAGADQIVLKDGVLEPVTDSDIALGTSGTKRFTNLFLSGAITAGSNANIGGNLNLNGAFEIDVASGDPTIIFDTQGADKFHIAVDDSDSDNFVIKSGGTVGSGNGIKMDSDGDVFITGDLTITGDDLFMNTNTDTNILVADGTNYNPVTPSGDVTLTNAGVFGIASGVIVNADVSASAAIAFSKMENLTTSRALVSDGNGDVSVSAVTSTEIGYLDGVTSSIQTQLDSGASVGKAIAMAIVFG